MMTGSTRLSAGHKRGLIMKSLAKELRQQATDAERMLWKHLRAHRMAGYKFRRQVVIEPYIADFVCLEGKLVVEADGGQHLEQVEADLKRSLFLESLGYKFMRFWNHEILCDIDTVLEQIHGSLIETPSPQPSPGGRGGQNLEDR
jgi:very-short-patch-repair endonuclease